MSTIFFYRGLALFGIVSRANPYIVGTMNPPQRVNIRWSEIESDPGRLFREMEAGNTVNIIESGGVNYTVAPTLRGHFTAIGTGVVVDANDLQQFLAKPGSRLRVLQLAIDPEAHIPEKLEQFIAPLPTSGLVPVEDIKQFLAESFDEAEAEDLVSLPSRRTGLDNTIFVSSGNPRHAPRIKIAVDPPDSFNPRSTSASMALHDYTVVGAYLSPHLIEQLKRFIELNRRLLLQHWNNEISGDEVVEKVVHLSGPPTVSKERSPRAASKKQSQKRRSRDRRKSPA
jgi:hypothetical protein